jgi:hypothetical protein
MHDERIMAAQPAQAGQRKALAIAVRNNKTEHRFSGLLARLTADMK